MIIKRIASIVTGILGTYYLFKKVINSEDVQFFSDNAITNAVPQVIGKMDDQIIGFGASLNFALDTNTIFQDPNGDFLNMTVKRTDKDGSEIMLPSWLTVVADSIPLLGKYEIGYFNSYDVAISGKIAYVPSKSFLFVFDVSDATKPVLLGNYSTPGYSHNTISVSGNKAYMASGVLGLYILNVTNPSNPRFLGSYNTPGYASDVSLVGNIAYVADTASGLQIIDVSNAASPVLLGNYPTSANSISVSVSGTKAYVADGTSGLKIIDVSNPASPVLLGTYNTAGIARDVTVSGTNAYIVSGSELEIVDVGNPASPVLLGNCNASALYISLSGTKAYLDEIGLTIVDVSDAVNPILLAKSYNSYITERGTVFGNVAYVAPFIGGILTYDLSLSNTHITFSGISPNKGERSHLTLMANDIYGNKASVEFNIIVTRFPFLRQHLLLSIGSGVVLVSGLSILLWKGYRNRYQLFAQLKSMTQKLQATPLHKLNLIPAQEIQRGQQIGGELSEVYSGKWLSTGTDIAIKVLSFSKGIIKSGAINTLYGEIEMMSALRHPNVVNIYGLYKDESNSFCVIMELMQGSLRELLNSNKVVEEDLRIHIALKVALGLKYLHHQAKPILHGDIKSANVLLDEKRHVKLTEFGFAKVIEDVSNQKPNNEEVVGTLPWMAPELLNDRTQYTAECDIYSYGMLLWEIYSRKIPFQNALNRSVLTNWKKEGREEHIPEDCPAVISNLIRGCWDKDPKARPRLENIIQQLSEYLATIELTQANVTLSKDKSSSALSPSSSKAPAKSPGTSTENSLKGNAQSSFFASEVPQPRGASSEEPKRRNPSTKKERQASAQQGLFRPISPRGEAAKKEHGLKGNVDSELRSYAQGNL